MSCQFLLLSRLRFIVVLLLCVPPESHFAGTEAVEPTDEPPATSSAQDAAAPATLDKGLKRLRDVLDAYDAHRQIEWVRDEKVELAVQPDPAKPPIVIVLDGPMVVGHPMSLPESVAFDFSSILSRQVFDVQDDKRRLTGVQKSHNVSRISLTYLGGLWRYAEICLSNGVQSAVGKVGSSGYVRWYPDGFELIGSTGGKVLPDHCERCSNVDNALEVARETSPLASKLRSGRVPDETTAL